MSSDEARQIVETGLERKKEERRQMDAALEAQERMLRLKINKNHEIQTYSEAQKKHMEQVQKMEDERKRREAWAKKQAEMAEKDMAAEDAVTRYGIWCLVILFVSAVTRLNFFVALALIAGLAVFPVVKVFRIYNPIK